MKTKKIYFAVMSILLLLMFAACSMPVGGEKVNPLEEYKYDLTTLEGFQRLIEDPEYLTELVEETQISEAAVDNPQLGDVNADGAVDIVDALLVAQYYVGLQVDVNIDVADVNLDGAIDILDALLIAQYYVGIIDTLPINIYTELKKITTEDAEDYDRLGFSAAIDGEHVIAGVPDEAGDGFRNGAAYIFYRKLDGADNWGQVKKLTASDAEDEDSFGISVALNGTYIIVGAEGEDGAGTDRGGAYIFNKDQGGVDNWGQVKKLTVSDAEDKDYFGYSVSIDGDYVIVGAQGDDGSGEINANRGAAYIFYKNQGGVDNWGEVEKITAGDAANDDGFGASVSISNGYIAIGAPWKDGTGGSEQGTVYIFSK